MLDEHYLRRLGKFDVVRSWGGVLHHTGAMWQALENVAPLVTGRGRLLLAIYNDQGRKTSAWKRIKKNYNKLPRKFKWLVLVPAFVRLWGPTMIRDIVKGQTFRSWRETKEVRGMSPWIDIVGWVGGWPFEVEKPEEVFVFYEKKNFRLLNLRTCGGGHGCNEFVFEALGNRA